VPVSAVLIPKQYLMRLAWRGGRASGQLDCTKDDQLGRVASRRALKPVATTEPSRAGRRASAAASFAGRRINLLAQQDPLGQGTCA